MADNLSSLISDAFMIYSEAYLKIGRIGLKVVELKGSPLQPKLWNELVYATRLYRVIEPSIVLNGGGTAIIAVVGDIATMNNLLLKLKRAVKLYTENVFPTPLTEFVFISGSGGDSDASYITAVLEGGLANSRRATAGTGISLIDGGPQGNMQINNTAALTALQVDTSGSTPSLNMASLIERLFYGSVNITGLKTWSIANGTNARRFQLNFVISGLTPGGSTHDQTFPATFKSSDGRWLSGQRWRPIEDGEYEASASTYDGVNWIISFGDKIS